jgi:hypothetical protein
MDLVISIFAALTLLLFPIWVAIQAQRKGYTKLLVIIVLTIVLSTLMPAILEKSEIPMEWFFSLPFITSLIIFFSIKAYRINWDYDPNPKLYVGCGTTFYGSSKPREDGSIITTQWFVILMLPLIPIQSYRVIKGGEFTNNEGAMISSTTNYMIFEKLHIYWWHVIRTYLFMLSYVFILWQMGSSLKNTSTPEQFESLLMPTIVGFTFIYVIIGYYLFRVK